MQKDLNESEQKKKKDFASGAISGGLLALGINIEKTLIIIIFPNLKNFELLFQVLSLISIIFSIYLFSNKYKKYGKLYGLTVYTFSFIGVFLLLITTNSVIIGVSLIPLFISADMIIRPEKWSAINAESNVKAKISSLKKVLIELFDRIGKNASRQNKELSKTGRRIGKNLTRNHRKKYRR
jgi:hypothetical protein